MLSVPVLSLMLRVLVLSLVASQFLAGSVPVLSLMLKVPVLSLTLSLGASS